MFVVNIKIMKPAEVAISAILMLKWAKGEYLVANIIAQKPRPAASPLIVKNTKEVLF